ncbi:MAG: hypothetical protein KJ630_12330 [Proteobacteria bacterium]|nr:hypothetical protein [Pseudomonadota bacterium]
MASQTLIDYAGFVQLPVVPGAVAVNLASLHQALQRLQPPKHALIVLPELWATGFAYQDLQQLQDSVVRLDEELRCLADRFDILLAGSLPEKKLGQDDVFYNTLKIVGVDGSYGFYRKKHLFPGEEKAFCGWPFSSPPVQTPLGNFGCMICYDIRFPDIARSQCQQGADMLLCASEWPAKRIHHLRALAISRAIENQTYLVACNGIGRSGTVDLGGHSLIVSPDGKVLCEAGVEESAEVLELQWSVQDEARGQFRSFAVATFPFSAQMKIVTPEACAEDTEKRWRAGQRVVFIRLEINDSFAMAVDRLERARHLGDHLVVAADFPESGWQNKHNTCRNLLIAYAALGCVGTIFPFEKMTSAIEHRLKDCSYLVLP